MLSALIVPFWGTYSLLNIRIHQAGQSVGEEIGEAIRNNELVTFTFTKEETKSLLRWIKPHEFKYRGKMYDIVESGMKGDSVWYLCYHHEEETRLRNHLSRLISGMTDNDRQKNDRTTNLLSFFKTLYFQDVSWKVPVLNEFLSINTTLLQHESTIEITPPVPPPKQCC